MNSLNSSLSKEYYNSDLYRYNFVNKGIAIKFLYYLRKAHFCRNKFIKKYYLFWIRLYRNKYGLEIFPECNIGKGLYIGHPYNITINRNAIIGCNCNIHKGVVIGQENRGKRKGTPVIGNKVWIGINAAIVGNVCVGDDVLIAPNTFVNCDVPSHSVVYGNPCIIKHRDNATENYINRISGE